MGPSHLFPMGIDGPSIAIDGFQLWPNALWPLGSLLEMQISNFDQLTFLFQTLQALSRLKITHFDFLPRHWFFSIGCCSTSSSGDVRKVSGRHIMQFRRKIQFSFEIHQIQGEIVSKTENLQIQRCPIKRFEYLNCFSTKTAVFKSERREKLQFRLNV